MKRENQDLSSTTTEKYTNDKPKSKRFRRMDDKQKEKYEYRKRLENACKTESIVEGWKIYEEMIEKSIQIERYMVQMILNLCVKHMEKLTLQENTKEELLTWKQKITQLFNKIQTATSIKMDETCYTSMIKICTFVKDITNGIQYVNEMNSKSMVPKLRTYSLLLQLCCHEKDQDQAEYICDLLQQHSIDLSETEYMSMLELYALIENPEKLKNTLYNYTEDILEIQQKDFTVSKLKQAFQSSACPPCPSGSSWNFQEGKVDDQGICSITKQKLKSIELSEEHQKDFTLQVEKLACTSPKRESQWKEFTEWLKVENQIKPFEVILDGANLGYYKQNFSSGCFDYRQIEYILNHYESQGKRVLIILHQSRTLDNAVPPKDRQMVQSWKETKRMYNCVRGNNDDWYWMYAALCSHPKALVVTNDEMRDHHFQMLHTRLFCRWKERHQVHYDLQGFHHDKVVVMEPRVYSRRSQQIQNSTNSHTWHFPINNEDVWFCIYPNSLETSSNIVLNETKGKQSILEAVKPI